MSELLTPEEFYEEGKSFKIHELDVLAKKQNDYGPYNIAKCPTGPLAGINVRLWDKLSRVNHLIINNVEPENESLRDSYLDIANYGTIGRMVVEGVWPGLD